MLALSYPNLDHPRGDGPGRAVNSPTSRGTAGPSAGVGCPATTLNSRKISTHMSLETTLGITADGIVPPGRAEQARALIQSGRNGGAGRKCPADARIEAFLAEHFADLGLPAPLRLPDETIVLPRHGIAREFSIPEGSDSTSNAYLQLVPRAQRRAAQPAERPPHHRGDVPRRGRGPADPRRQEGRPAAGLRGPVPARPRRRRRSCCVVPFTANRPRAAAGVRLAAAAADRLPRGARRRRREDDGGPLLRAGGLVSNLDFVESIFGNAGDPYLPENDAGLDVEHWTGHTGCVILAPHLTQLTKKELGLPALGRARPSGSGATGCAGATRPRSTTTARRSSSPAATAAGRDRHADRRQLLRLLQEGGEDADLLRRQPATATSRRSTPAGRWPSPATTSATTSTRGAIARNGRTLADVVRDDADIDRRSSPRGTRVDRQFPDLVYVPARRPGRASTGCRSGGRRTASEAAIPLLPGQDLHDPLGLQGAAREAPRRRRAGG